MFFGVVDGLDHDPAAVGARGSNSVDRARSPLDIAIELSNTRWRNGTAVWKVRRPGVNDPVELKVTPFTWPAPLVDSRMLDDNVGYVRLKIFVETKDALRDSASLVRVRLEQLAYAGARSFVFDLRGNPGGVGVDKVIPIFFAGEPMLLFRTEMAWTRCCAGKEKRGPGPCRLFSLWIAEPSRQQSSQPMPFSNTSPP
jgi:hypothetical protein